MRQLLSGADKNRQATVQLVKVTRVIQLFIEKMKMDTSQEPKEALKYAIQVSGARRPDSMKAMANEWNGVMYWSLSCADITVDALRTLEEAGLAATPGSLRSFRKLVTPEYWQQLSEEIRRGIRTASQLEHTINVLRHEQWVSFHWRSDNPMLDAEKSVSFFLHARRFSSKLSHTFPSFPL